jgi:mannose-6-phosphate isomerase-like protein (cupin superfamily)
MKGFVQDIEGLAVKNNEFRRVLYTAKDCQLVVMALKPKEEIGAEVHKLDQFFRVEEGSGEAVLDGVRTAIRRPSRSSSRPAPSTTSSITGAFH